MQSESRNVGVPNSRNRILWLGVGNLQSGNWVTQAHATFISHTPVLSDVLTPSAPPLRTLLRPCPRAFALWHVNCILNIQRRALSSPQNQGLIGRHMHPLPQWQH